MGIVRLLTLLLLLLPAACSDGDATSRAAETRGAGSAEPTRSDGPAGATPPPPLHERCGMESLRGVQTVRFEAADGAKLFGVEMGRGPRGLVLLHGSAMAGICDWSTGLDRLVADGFHLLAFDQRCYGYSSCPTGHGMDLDVRAAVEQLRDLGARSVVGIGGNQGSSVMLAAAAWPDSGMDAVVALSGGMPHEFYSGPRPLRDPVALAGRIDVPVLFASGRDDEGVVDQDRYRAAFRATGSPQSEYVVLPRGGHAMSMLGLTEPSAFYRRAFLGFLIEHSFSKRRDGR